MTAGAKTKPAVSLIFPPLFGAGFFCLWFFAALFAYSGFEVMGEADETLRAYVESNYFWFSILFQASILGVTAAVGALVGLLSALLGRRFGGRITAYGLPVFFWVVMVQRLLVRQPQFFDGPFLDQRPVLKEIFFFSTAWLDPFMVDFAAALAALALLYVPLAATAAWTVRSRKRAAAIAVIAVGWNVYEGRLDGLLPAQKEKPNVLLIVIDSLRSDHLSMNGYERDTTPVIDSLAERGAIFEKVIVDLPRTFPSWITMMTGQYSMTHGVRHMFPTAEQRRLIHPPLPRIMAEKGWSTAVAADFAGDIFPRVDLGFQTVDAPDFTFDDLVKIRNLEIHPLSMSLLNNAAGEAVYPSIREMVYNCDPAALAGRVSERLRSFNRDRPFFLAVFFSATHIPYAAPGPYYKRYAKDGYSGPHRFQKKDLLMTENNLTPSDRRHLVDLYDGALRAVDDQIGAILDDLENLGYADNTIIAVTGDHGENFYEHYSEVGHGNHLKGPHAVTTPLVIHSPDRKFAVRRVKWQARSVDLAPTLAELSGAAMPETAGRSLLPMLEGVEVEHRLAYSETGLWYVNEGPFFFQDKRIKYPGVTRLCEVDGEWRGEVVIKNRYQPLVTAAKHRMISDGRFKLIVMPTAEGVETELYDLAADPREAHDLSEKLPGKTSEMMVKLKTLLEESSSAEFFGGIPFSRREFQW
ncbi:MAG: sulfatase family protein [Candidatus Nitrospinota bacterium M3_3B_026]